MSNDSDIRESRTIENALTQRISNWLIERGLARTSFEDLLAGFCDRLDAAGLPLLRGMITMRTLHPSIEALNFAWWRGSDVDAQAFQIDSTDDTDWLKSPVRYMLQNGLYVLRRQLAGPHARVDFPVLEGFQARGGTDYYLRAIGFDMGMRSHETTGAIFSFVSDHAEGFGDDQIAVLERLLPRLALALKGALILQIAETVLDTYVGHQAGARIMQGDIRRGSLSVVNAVILYADLRGFTRVTDSVPRDELATLMDAYFEAMVPPVIDHGGEVLKYLGDGMLATFRLDDAREFAVCGDALQAAHDMQSRIAALNQTRAAMKLPTMGLDVVMHLGEVLYGNVGAGDRLDFTVIGPAVNEASRIELLCKELGHPILISEAFAKAAQDCADRLIPVGTHTLRDIREAQALYTIEVGGQNTG